MKMRKSRLSMAIASSLAAAAFYPAVSSAVSIDVGNGNVGVESGGDTLIYPLYTTGPDGGTNTSFSLTNTSDSQVVITKIRFREQLNSMDALDWIMVLSPNDKFDFVVTKPSGSDRPVMRWNDSSCIVGPGQGATQVTFPVTNENGGNNNSYVYDETALRAGHVEILSMAGITPGQACLNEAGNAVVAGPCASGATDLATAATHVNGAAPPNCDALRTVLTSQQLTYQLAQLNGDQIGTAAANLDAPNSLIGRYVVTVPGSGIEAGGDAMAIRNSNLPLASQSTSACSTTAGVSPPANRNCISRYNWDRLEYDHPHLADMGAGVDHQTAVGQQLVYFQNGLSATNVAGDWSNNPSNSVGVDWLLSFPTKYTYLNPVSLDPNNEFFGFFEVLGYARSPADGITGSIGVAGPYQTGQYDSTEERTSGPGCLTTTAAAYGIEEEEAQAGEVISPSPTGTTPTFCNETNFLTFSVNGQTTRPSYLASDDANGDTRRQTFELTVNSVNTVTRGWALMSLGWGSSTSSDAVRGSIFTVRDTDQAQNNNASMTELQQTVGGDS